MCGSGGCGGEVGAGRLAFPVQSSYLMMLLSSMFLSVAKQQESARMRRETVRLRLSHVWIQCLPYGPSDHRDPSPLGDRVALLGRVSPPGVFLSLFGLFECVSLSRRARFCDFPVLLGTTIPHRTSPPYRDLL